MAATTLHWLHSTMDAGKVQLAGEAPLMGRRQVRSRRFSAVKTHQSAHYERQPEP
jgi:hypothetical protein